ncbi:ferritin family protein [Syntrophomonas erecta subsp. sporosyntropha]
MGWTTIKFSGEEIIEIAVQMEESGKLFYEKAISLAEGDKLKEVLTYLAQEEAKHVQDFSKLGESIRL